MKSAKGSIDFELPVEISTITVRAKPNQTETMTINLFYFDEIVAFSSIKPSQTFWKDINFFQTHKVTRIETVQGIEIDALEVKQYMTLEELQELIGTQLDLQQFE